MGRLPYTVTEEELRKEFQRYGPLKSIQIVHDTQGKPRGYAFIEFERERDMKTAYTKADGIRLPGHSMRIVVDVERGRTVKGWLPRRLGGGLGRTRVGGKEVNQRFSGRDSRANDAADGNSHSHSRSPKRQHRDHYSGSNGDRDRDDRHGGDRRRDYR